MCFPAWCRGGIPAKRTKPASSESQHQQCLSARVSSVKGAGELRPLRYRYRVRSGRSTHRRPRSSARSGTQGFRASANTRPRRSRPTRPTGIRSAVASEEHRARNACVIGVRTQPGPHLRLVDQPLSHQTHQGECTSWESSAMCHLPRSDPGHVMSGLPHNASEVTPAKASESHLFSALAKEILKLAHENRI